MFWKQQTGDSEEQNDASSNGEFVLLEASEDEKESRRSVFMALFV